MTDDDFDPSAFAAAFQRFLGDLERLAPPARNVLLERVSTHLGADPATLPSLTERYDPSEHPNLQLAIDELADEGGWELIGLPGELRNYGSFTLSGLLAGRMHGLAQPGSVEYERKPVDVDRTYPCVLLGLYLARHGDRPLAIMLASGLDHGPRAGLSIEVVGEDRDVAHDFVRQLTELMEAKNVYRGKVLSFTFSEYGAFGLAFHRLPAIERDDVILPADDLDAIERHTIGVSQRAETLRLTGRHLKRGLLLYGPPGTGKTLSVMYLANRMAGRTTLLLSGPGAGALGRAVAIARHLQPATVVLEDVDLVAMERTMPGMATNPLLFQLLNEMDGLAADADVLFVLTTNRAELLEPALAARPGRIDQAVEIKLPDADGRARLFELYLRGLDADVDNLPTLVAATEGVSAAFIRELVRRAVLYATGLGQLGAPRITGDHLDQALADLVVHSNPLTRAALGAGGHHP